MTGTVPPPATLAEVPAPFDVCGPLPTGTTVLEASAGTGKTFTIAALATRYVAEGRAELGELMLVTFSRAATQELRERVRERLADTERGLGDPTAHPDDQLVALLADAPADEVARRRHRIGRALAAFDAATIATTHGFCQQMLAGLGVAGDADPGADLVENLGDLVAEVADDAFLQTFVDIRDPPIDHATARQVALDAAGDPHAALVATGAAPGTAADARYRLATGVRAELERRKRDARVLGYDDLLVRLRDALLDPDRGPAACARVRARYRVVMVDEFQDTDPVQWEILRTAFHGSATLVLIGDPKQAVYAFRGADLVTYLRAVEDATQRRTLAVNWRSDEDLVAALGVLFGGAALGDHRIVVRPVAAEHSGRRLTGAGPPVRLRVADRSVAPSGRTDLPLADGARTRLAADVAADVAGLLGGPATVAVDGPPRSVRPADVAVLVRTNKQALLVRQALSAAGVPAVLTGSRSVYLSPVAREWLALLRALEQPHRAALARAAALTVFVGWTADRLAALGDAALDELGPRLRRWRDVLSSRGVAALLEVIGADEHLAERLLATPTGQRDLTDLRHVGQALHAAAVEGRLGPAALVTWLGRRVREAAEDADDESSQRLESDADAVQVITVHGSKGLQFPVVYVPFGWDRWVPTDPDPLRLHAADGTRLLDVSGKNAPGYAERRGEHQREEAGEDLRLLYVALTRAQCQAVVWWAPTTVTEASSMHRLLLAPFRPGGQPVDCQRVPADAGVLAAMRDRLAAAGAAVSVEPMVTTHRQWASPPAPAEPLAVATFTRRLDVAWRRTSYSGLTAPLHDLVPEPPGVTSEPERTQRQDELVAAATPTRLDPAGAGRPVPAAPASALVPSPMAALPAGPAFGTLVHEVLERVDTGAADLAAEVRSRSEEAIGHRYGTAIDPAVLAAGLLPVLDTPLGPLGGHRRLREVPVADRLAELTFELPLAGGDRPGTVDATVAHVASLLRDRLGADDPLAGYPDALDVPAVAGERLRGYLTGSIDAVLRLRDPVDAPAWARPGTAGGTAAGAPGGAAARTGDGEPRYVVVDYKTNWLGAGAADVGDLDPSGAEAGPRRRPALTAWHYRPQAMADAMIRGHYPLQALLYGVALHRYLRWRQPGYDPARHLGGVLYLFVRGMCGPDTPVIDGQPCGVFAWQPPGGLVEALSDLLDRGPA